MSKKVAEKIKKSTKYCNLLTYGKVNDEEYTYIIEKIFVKAKKKK